MTNLLDKYCFAVFGEPWGLPDLRYQITPDKHSDERVARFLAHVREVHTHDSQDLVVLNISAGETRRDPAMHQLPYLAKYLAEKKNKLVVVVGAPNRHDRIRSVCRSAAHPSVIAYPQSGRAPFMDMVSLIRQASYLVSPDTSLMHVASATETPAVGLYSSFVDFSEWSPLGIVYEPVFDPNQSAVRNIHPLEIAGAVDRLEARIAARG